MPALYKIFLILVIATFSCAFDMAFIEEQPKGIARDFYIYEYLQHHSTQDEALRLYELIHAKTPKMLKMLKSKIPRDKLPRDMYCMDLPFNELIASDDECLNLGFKLQYALDYKLTDEILARINNPKLLRQINILRSSDVLESLLQSSGEDFNGIYFNVGNREKIFNRAPKNLQSLSHKNYAKSLYHLVISQKYPQFTKALLKANITDVNDWSFYALGLNELLDGSEKKALLYFEGAKKATTSALMKDRATFWQYKISGKDTYLEELANSSNFNIYSLYATQKLQIEPKYEIITQDDMIFKSLKKEKAPFDVKNPFEWQILSSDISMIDNKDSLLDVAKMFYYEDTLPHFTFILNRYYDFSKHFFITPYKQNLDVDDDTQNLVYAVAKQESRFIPSVVSRSYALGIMQIMPFNVESFAKAQDLPQTQLEDMFNPSVGLQFGAYYLNHLKKEFIHPLFVAYAYNGGPTFIRKFLASPNTFRKQNKYDPWLSMEFIPYEESRFYGLKVMANYIVYSEISGKHIDVENFLQETLR